MGRPLPLDDPRWSSLRTAYGPAGRIPDVLRRFFRGEDVCDELWSSLCHQGTVYTATYASLPHLVVGACTREVDARIELWAFAGAVTISEDRDAMPAWLDESYREAIARAERAAIGDLDDADEADALRLIVAIAGLRAERAIEHAAVGLGDRELTATCPGCSRSLFITLGSLPYVAHAEDPAGRRRGRSAPLAARPPRAAVVELVRLARAAGHAGLADRVAALDADVTCPICSGSFPLVDARRRD